MQILIDIKPLSVNKAWQGKRYKTPAYKAFEKEAMLCLPSGYPVPKEGDLEVYLEWGFSSKLSDWDNPIKTFVDVLQKKYDFDDVRIVRGVVEKKLVKKGQEYIIFNIKELEK